MTAWITAHAADGDWKQQFQTVSDEYFDQVVFPNAPTEGTLAGYHQYDGQLENLSRKNIDAEIAALKQTLVKLDAVQAQMLKERAPQYAGTEPKNIDFKVSVSAEGKLSVLGIVHQDSNISPDVVEKLEKSILSQKLRPALSNGVPTEKTVVMRVSAREYRLSEYRRVQYPLDAADAGDDPSLGEECGQLFEPLRERGVCADGAQVCFAG